MNKHLTVFQGAQKEFTIKAYPVLKPETGMAGLELITSGICGTDVHIHGGYLGMPDLPLVIGHEFIGQVTALGAGAAADALGHTLHVGTIAIACVAVPCGLCLNCRKGETASCLAFGVTYVKSSEEPPHFHGGFAEYLFSPARNLVSLPKEVDPLAAAAFPCGGPTIIRACAYGGGLDSGELVVIQGNGPLGLFATAWAKAHHCHVIVIGSAANPQRTELTRRFGADLFIDYRNNTDAEILAQITAQASTLKRGNGADVVIETSGAPTAFSLGLKMLRTRGRYYVPGQYSDRGTVAIEPHAITFKALQIIGSGQYTLADIGTYLHFLKCHPELQTLFAETLQKFPVGDVNQAMAAAERGDVIKAVLVSNLN